MYFEENIMKKKKFKECLAILRAQDEAAKAAKATEATEATEVAKAAESTQPK